MQCRNSIELLEQGSTACSHSTLCGRRNSEFRTTASESDYYDSDDSRHPNSLTETRDTLENTPVNLTETRETLENKTDHHINDLLGCEEGEGAPGPPLNDQLMSRWSTYISKGVEKDQFKEMYQKYPLSSNGELLQAPQVNPEVLVLLSNDQKSTDSYLTKAQNCLGKGLVALGQVLSESLDKLENTESNKTVIDAAKFFSGAMHSLTHIEDMYKPFFDDPVKTYEYYNFLPDARDDLKDNDDVVVLPPDARYLTDEEELD
ncbi:unnamed protein product [Acanthoscelides obtectus]|uniref:Uncharacterized protein n=1 Tax=Acanthoscelides obtectus TaxID=200917 RepID=A0A9P0LM27_ACAOB|nr:unnamed protein product [Acanthoscelides obtectus]CAK1632202.1 hypothetical protein AOBTE_LOCUS7406 [Acanthoscelides obtectus]